MEGVKGFRAMQFIIFQNLSIFGWCVFYILKIFSLQSQYLEVKIEYIFKIK